MAIPTINERLSPKTFELLLNQAGERHSLRLRKRLRSGNRLTVNGECQHV